MSNIQRHVGCFLFPFAGRLFQKSKIIATIKRKNWLPIKPFLSAKNALEPKILRGKVEKLKYYFMK